MFKISSVLLLSIGLSFTAVAQATKNTLHLDKGFVQSELESAAKQIKVLGSSLQENEIPTTYANGKHVDWGTGWWCSGFYPGTVLYLYEYTKDPSLLAEANNKLKF